MTLTQFLQWLYGVISKVIAWFGDRFSIYVSILDTIDDRIKSFIETRTKPIVDWVNVIANDIKKLIRDTVNAAIALLNNSITLLRSDFYKLLDNLKASLSGSVQGFLNLLDSLRKEVSDHITWALNTVKQELKSYFDPLIDTVIRPFRPLLDLLRFIPTILTFVSSDMYSYYMYLKNSVIPFIVGFINNPLTFILDIISPLLFSIMCWLLALAIGTVKYSIDITPPWKKH